MPVGSLDVRQEKEKQKRGWGGGTREDRGGVFRQEERDGETERGTQRRRQTERSRLRYYLHTHMKHG